MGKTHRSSSGSQTGSPDLSCSFIFIFLYSLFLVCVPACGGQRIHTVPRNLAQAVTLVGKPLYPVSHLSRLLLTFLYLGQLQEGSTYGGGLLPSVSTSWKRPPSLLRM